MLFLLLVNDFRIVAVGLLQVMFFGVLVILSVTPLDEQKEDACLEHEDVNDWRLIPLKVHHSKDGLL